MGIPIGPGSEGVAPTGRGVGPGCPAGTGLEIGVGDTGAVADGIPTRGGGGGTGLCAGGGGGGTG